MKRPAVIAIVVAAVLVLCVGAAAYAANWWVEEFEAATAKGKASAVAGISSLAALDATGAASQFAEATDSFEYAEQLMGPSWVGDVVGVVPWARRHYAAVEDLVGVGQAGATVGTEIAALMRIEPTPSTAGSESENDPLLASGQKHVLAALRALNDAAERSKRLNEDGLIGPVASQVRALNALLRERAPFLDRVGPLYRLASKLLPAEQRFLVASNSSAELRPTGGFIGTYGILVVGPSGIEIETYENVYSLPNPPGRVPMPPGATMAKDFQFRDANWWLDHPTSAEAMLGFWEDCGQPPVDGIITVDVIGISRVLGVLGPIELKRFSETFSEENLLERLTYYVEVASGGGDSKKAVVAALADALEERFREAAPQELALTLMALAAAADEKHVQLYLLDPEAQAAAVELGWSGAIAPQEGTTDVLAVSNAMNVPSKVNFSMRKRIDYQVALEPDGSADTTLALGYANKGRMVIPEPGVFGNYLRVYRAPGTLIEPDDISAVETGTVDVDLPMAVREFKVRRGQSRTETIVTRIPSAWRAGQGAGTSSYRLYIVRQADLEDVPTTVSVTPPAGWRVTTVTAREVASGKSLPVTNRGGVARLAVPLKADTVLDVGLARE